MCSLTENQKAKKSWKERLAKIQFITITTFISGAENEKSLNEMIQKMDVIFKDEIIFCIIEVIMRLRTLWAENIKFERIFFY